MGRRTSAPFPVVHGALVGLGQNIRLARLRRGLTAALVAERAGMARDTLRALEQGDPGVSLGSLANVLHALGLSSSLSVLAADDVLGRKLQDAQLEESIRPARPRTKKPPRDTVDLASVVGNDLDRLRGQRALVWVASRDWVQTFLPGAPPRERAPEALRVGDEVVITDVLSASEPVFLLVERAVDVDNAARHDQAGRQRVVMLGDLRIRRPQEELAP
jgi:transcriptional regulator with XRE-family HTH domain